MQNNKGTYRELRALCNSTMDKKKQNKTETKNLWLQHLLAFPNTRKAPEHVLSLHYKSTGDTYAVQHRCLFVWGQEG